MGSFGGFGSTQGSQATSISSAAFPLLAPNGTAAAPSYSFSGDPDTGINKEIGNGFMEFSVDGTDRMALSTSKLFFPSTISIGWTDGTITGAAASTLVPDSANVLALKNGTTAQEFRVYGTTTGPKYVSLIHDGSNASVRTVTGGGNLNLGAAGSDDWTIGGTLRGLTSTSNLRFAHGTSALATTATEGFFHLNTTAGAPTGVPASIPTGQVPMVFDTTNSRLYIYHGAAWHYIAQTA